MLKNKKKLLKIIFAGAAVLGILSIFIFRKNNEMPIVIDTYEVNTGSFTDQITLRGTATPEDTAELSFPVSGRISRIYTSETKSVKAGARLGELSLGTLSASQRELQGLIAFYEAQKEDLLSGKRPEEIQIIERELQIENAKLDQMISDAVLLSRTLYEKVDNEIRNGTDVFYINPNTDTPKLSFSIPKYPVQSNRAELYRIRIRDDLKTFEQESKNANSGNIEALLPRIRTYLETVRTFLDDNAVLVNGLETTNGVSQSSIDSWRTIVSGARTEINTSLETLQAQKQNIENQKNVIARKEDELNLAKAGPTTFSIKQIDAQITQARARLDGISAEISDRTLIAPFSGIVTDITKSAGEIVSPGETIITILSDQKLSFILDVPESDISNLRTGQSVIIKPDSLEGIEYTGIISRINPSESIKEGVTVYEVTVAFSDDSNLEALKSGMTGDAEIALDTKENVIAIPRRFLYTEQGQDFVYIFDETLNQTTKQNIEVLEQSADKQNIIVSGLSNGQIIGIPRI